MRKQMRSVFACLLALVMIVSMIPGVSFAASKKACIVTNQKQLEQALKGGKKDIQVKTAKKVKLTILALKQAKSATITINAKNATVTNKASLKSVVIKDASAFVESGKNNTIRISDKKLSLTVTTQSKGTKFKVVSKSDLTVSGTAKEPVKITVIAKNTTINAKAKIDVALSADAALTFVAGAEGSKITTAKNVTANVVNNTKGIVVMKDSTGNTTKLAAGEKHSVTDKYPKVDFSKSDDVLTGNVSFERNKLLLTVEFYSDEQVIDKNGKELDNWTVEANLYNAASDKYCLDKELEFSGENDEKITAVFEIFEDTVGKHSMQFDYEVYQDKDATQLLGKKTFTVNYEITQDNLDKLNASYKGKIMAAGKNKIQSSIKDDQIRIDVKRWETEEGDDVFLQVDIQKGDMVCRVRQTDWV